MEGWFDEKSTVGKSANGKMNLIAYCLLPTAYFLVNVAVKPRLHHTQSPFPIGVSSRQ